MSDLRPTPVARRDTSASLPPPLSNTTTLLDAATERTLYVPESDNSSDSSLPAPPAPPPAYPAAGPQDPDRIAKIATEDTSSNEYSPSDHPPSDTSIRPSPTPARTPPAPTAVETPINSKTTTVEATEVPSNPLVRSWVPAVNRNIFQRIGDRIQRKENKSTVTSKLKKMLKMGFLDEYLASQELWQVVAGAETLSSGDDWVYGKLSGLVTLKEQQRQKVDWDAVENRVRLARSSGGDV